jgi:hypothetical protein
MVHTFRKPSVAMRLHELTYEQFIEALDSLLYISDHNQIQVGLYGKSFIEKHNAALNALRKEYIVDHDEEPYYPFSPLQPTDGRPTEQDGDEDGFVQYLYEGVWRAGDWKRVAEKPWPWCHTPRWKKSPKGILKQIEECPRSLLDQKITYHVPKELVDSVREWCGLE